MNCLGQRLELLHLADAAMLEFDLVGVHLLGDLDDILRHRGPCLLLGTLNLVPLVTGLYGSLVRFISLS